MVLDLGSDRLEEEIGVSLICWGPPVIGEPLKLSMLELGGTFWTSGRIDVLIDDRLEAGELAPVDCVQTAVDTVATDAGKEWRLSFNGFAPGAAVGIVLTERPARGCVRVGTAIDVGNPRITARTAADVSVERGTLRRLSAALQPGWTIDAVETIPAAKLGEWYVDRSHEPPVLDVQLQQAVAPDHPVRVVLSARFERPGGVDPLSISQLNPLDWSGLSTTRNLLQLRAAEQFELDVAADLQPIGVSTLSAPERELFTELDDAPLCDLAASPPAAAIRLALKQGTYDATIQIDAELTQGQLRQSYRVACRPRGSGIDHVLVYLSQPTARPLEWIETDSGARLPAERMPDDDPRLGGLPRGGELWLVDLGRLYVRPFAIFAHSSQSWPQRERVPLASLPDAASQQGRATVSSAAVEMPTIVAEGMSPTSLPIGSAAAALEESAAVRAVYRFQPTRFYDAGQPAQLWVGPAVASTEGAKLVATHVDVESRYAANGLGVHRATYRLQNGGLKALKLTFPKGVQLEWARLDGEPVTVTSPDRIGLSLPPRSEFPLELELSSRQPSFSSGQQVSSPLPSGAVAIVGGRWRVSLPHGFEATNNVTSNAAALTWRDRWFGPVARRQDDQPFNPFAARDWNAMWAGLSRAVATPALAESPAPAKEPTLPTGWHTMEVDFVAGPPAAITIAHRPATSAVGLALFLACALIPRLVIHARGLMIVLLAIVAAAISLFLPAFFAPLGAAATVGFCAAALWQAWHRIGLKNRLALVSVALVVTCSPIALADETPAAIEQLFVPVDAAGKPAGTKCFVSGAFLRHLMHRASTAASDDGWLIADMRCDGELIPVQGPHPEVRAARWSLTLEVETLTRDGAIRLPLQKVEADWPAAASIDGIPAPLEWDETGRACTVHIAEPGRHQLSIAFVPRMEAAADRNSIALTLPKIPGAAVSIAAPAALAELRCEGRPYVRHDEANHIVWRSELDDSGRLTAGWNIPHAEATVAPSRGVDQFSSLQIQPDGVLLTIKLRRHERGKWPATIDFALDEHWELLGDGDAGQAGEVERMTDGRKLLVRTDQGIADRREIALRFRSSNDSSLGRIFFPNIKPISLSVASHRIAVNCDADLECVPSFIPPANTSPPTDFADLLPAGKTAPQIVVDASKVEPNSYLSVRPREAVSSCEDRMALAASKRRLRFTYRCDVTPQGADRFGWSLRVPAQIDVEGVAVRCGQEIIPVDWTRQTPTRLAIQFAREAAKPYEVELSGSMTLGSSEQLPIPQIGPLRAPGADQVVALYRDEDVLAQWQLPDDAPAIEAAASAASAFGEPLRFVGARRIQVESLSRSLIVVKPNRTRVRGDTLTVVSRDDDTWTATFHANLQVDHGVVDVLRLQAPTNWAGPFEVKSAGKASLARPTNNSTLVIRLSQAVSAGGSVQLSVKSPLLFADGEVPIAPRIKLLHAGECKEFFALPATIGGQKAAWTRRGIGRAELPESLRQQIPASGDVETFCVTGDSINVALRPRTTRASSANVRLAETAVRVGPQGGMVTVTRFVLAPEGLPNCLLKLPDDSELVRLQLDGHTALARSIDPQTWQIQLGPPDLPQILEVATQSREATTVDAGAVELQRPVLENSGQPIPVEFSLWTLRRARAAGTPRVTGGSLVTPAELAAARFDRLLSISQSATRAVIESPLVDGYNWFARWASELEAAAHTADSMQRQTAGTSAPIRVPQPDESLVETAARYEAWLDQINEIFAAAEWTAAASNATAGTSLDFGSPFEIGLGDQVCFISDGNEQRALVEFVSPGMTPMESRFVALISLAALGAVAFWLSRRPEVLVAIGLWPEAAALVLGLLAWAWLRPSVFGLLLAAASAALLARRLMRARKSPRHDSSNQPSENAERLA